ncbi:MAG: hypothetical protein ACI9L9_000811, partial [Marivirga sp.]
STHHKSSFPRRSEYVVGSYKLLAYIRLFEKMMSPHNYSILVSWRHKPRR